MNCKSVNKRVNNSDNWQIKKSGERDNEYNEYVIEVSSCKNKTDVRSNEVNVININVGQKDGVPTDCCASTKAPVKSSASSWPAT